MTGVVLVNPRTKFTNSAGVPLALGWVTVYQAGTTTLANTWQDKAQTTLNTNPIHLDANGECLLWGDSAQSYKLLLQDVNLVTVTGWPVDNVPGAADVGAAATAAAAAAAAQVTLATAQAGAAASSATVAAAAAGTAFTNANVYASTAAGIAATALTGQFTVIVGDEAIRYRVDAGPVATEVARYPTAAQARSTSLADGIKKAKSQFPLNAFTNSAYISNGAINALTVAVPAGDLVYKALRVKSELAANQWCGGSGLLVRPQAVLPVGSDGQWATIGYVARDAASSFHANGLRCLTATGTNGTGSIVFVIPNASDRGTFDLDSTHRLYWAQVQLPAGSDGKFLFAGEPTAVGTTDFVAAPFMFITSAKPALSELDIFQGERGAYAQDYADATKSTQLVDTIKATTVAGTEFSLANGATTATVTVAEVVNTFPSGSAISFAPDPVNSPNGQLIMTSVAGLSGKYVHLSVYLYSQSGDWTGVSGGGAGVSFFLRNDATNVAASAAATTRMTNISSTLRRFDFVAPFDTAGWTKYGAAARCIRTNNIGPAHPFYFFGLMGVVQDTPDYDSFLQPTAWVPKNEVARGYQVQTLTPTTPTAWAGKKIVWFGTSIPASGGYPEAVASALGAASVSNIAISGSTIRAFQEDNSWFAQSLLNTRFSLEISDVNARFGANLGFEVNPADYLTRQPGSGFVLAQAHLDALVASNWVALLQPKILANDLFVFDYGINDRNGQTTFPFQLPAAAAYDRRYFAGAMNYIYKKIHDQRQASGLRTQAVFITHHTRSTTSTNATDVVDSQIAIAKYWGAHVINLADNVGFNDLTLLELTDGLHFSPGSEAELRIRQYIIESLKRIYP